MTKMEQKPWSVHLAFVSHLATGLPWRTTFCAGRTITHILSIIYGILFEMPPPAMILISPSLPPPICTRS